MTVSASKYLSKFWKCRDLALLRTTAVVVNPDAKPTTLGELEMSTTRSTFQINNTKLYAPVGTLCINENIKT